MTGWISVGVTPSSIMSKNPKKERRLGSRRPATLVEQARLRPVCDKARAIVRLRALPHLAHLLGKSLGPGEPPRELARRARLEEEAVAPGLHQVGERAEAARDHRQAA